MPPAVFTKVAPLVQRKLKKLKTRAARFHWKAKKPPQTELVVSPQPVSSIFVYNGTIVITNSAFEGKLWKSQPGVLYKGKLSDRGLELEDSANPWFDLNPLQSKQLCDSESSSGESDVTRVDDGLNEWGLPKCLVEGDDEEETDPNAFQVVAEERTVIGSESIKRKKITVGLYRKQKLLIVVVFLILIVAKNKHSRRTVRSKRVFTRAKVNSKGRLNGRLPALGELVEVRPRSIVTSQSYLSGLTLVGNNKGCNGFETENFRSPMVF
jgi:hypothetical protein